ncbi:ABC transporter family substrate-binding protein [Bowdeniella nasicola]|nr:ABC transporter family substrate-binding protein [Bowdeniella nasicola]
MRKITRAMTAVAAAGVLALAGCSGGSGGGNNGNKGTGGPANDSGTQINAKDRSELQEGGVLRIPISKLPSNWNGMHIDGNEADISDMLGYTLPSNWLYKPDGTFEVNPNFLESYDVKDATGDSPQVVTLKLNKKAKWNNGDPITWEDYAQTAKVCDGSNVAEADPESDAEPTDKYVCASTDGWTSVEKVEKGADEYEVVVTFKNPYPDWSGTFSGVLKKDSIKDPETYNTGWKTDMPNDDWLAGPFKFESVDRSAGRVALVPNDKWWGDKALLEKVEFKALGADAIPGAFANKELDVTGGIIDANTYQTVIKRADAEVRVGTGKTWRHYTINSQAEVMSDQKVRQAIAMGMDRVQTTKSDLAGIDIIKPEELVLGNHFFMPDQEGYVDNSNVTPYDPEKAGALLDEIGWKLEEGKEFRTKGGKELEIKYLAISGISTSENEGKMLQDQMKKIGIKVTIVPTSSNEFFKQLQRGEYEIATFSWVGTNYPMANIDQIYGAKSSSNFAKLEIPKVTELVPEIAKEMDKKKRIDLTNEVDKAIWEAVHTVPIYQRAQMIATPKNLANYGAFGLSSGKPEDIGYTK